VGLLILLTVGLAGCGDPETMAGDEGVFLSWAGDVFSAGQSVVVEDTVPGDALLTGGDVRFDGLIVGEYFGAGGDQTIDGRVENSVRAAGGQVGLRGEVGRNVMVAGGRLEIGEEATVGRNAYLAGGQVEVRGTIRGSLRVGGGEVTLNGPVSGDVEVEAERLRVGPDARIGGDLRYRVSEDEGEEAFSMSPEAEVSGTVTARPPRSPEGGGGETLFRVLRILAFVLAGSVVVALFPSASGAIGAEVRQRTLASLGVGLLLVILVPVTVGVVGLTVIGIPLAVMLAALFAILVYLGAIPPALWLGHELPPRRPEGQRSARVADFAVGGTMLGVVTFVPLLGFVVRVLFTLAGLGAAGLLIRNRGRE